jgi:acyl-CoA reductase-like NAD-dependent aldehyde dehydrogenase
MSIIKLSSVAEEFIYRKTHFHYWGGESREVKKSKSQPIFNPATGLELSQITWGGETEVNEAVKIAHRAFGRWSKLSAYERAIHLHRLADEMEKQKEVLAQIESVDVGKAIAATRGFDIPFGIQCVRYFADLATQTSQDIPLSIAQMEARIHKASYGVCGFIFPWNFPFNLLLWGVIPALAAGNTVVIKPSEVTPLSTLFMAELAKKAGIPDGVINVVLGDGSSVGVPLTEHSLVRRMSFTGSGRAGADVAQRCGRRIIPCKLELGGKGAAVLFEDTDLERASVNLANAITFNSGQVCCTATRWLVHEKIYDSFVEKVVKELKNVKIGNNLDEETQMGPLASAAHKARVLGYLDQGLAQGATAILVPDRMASKEGYFVSPFLLEGNEENICCREEIFGPTAYLMKFTEENEAVDRVNQLAYGLANSVWSSDLKRANRVAEQLFAGNNWINAHNVFAYGLPYGGVNQSGLGGGVNSPETMSDYFVSRTIARPLN